MPQKWTPRRLAALYDNGYLRSDVLAKRHIVPPHQQYRVRPTAWQGESALDLIQEFAPFAVELCQTFLAVDAIACIFRVDADTGHARLYPVSAEYPMSEVNHFIPAHTGHDPQRS